MIQRDELKLTLADLQIDEHDMFCFQLDNHQRASLSTHAKTFLDDMRSLDEKRKTKSQSSTGISELFQPHAPSATISHETMQQALEQLVDYFERRNVNVYVDRPIGDEAPHCFVDSGPSYQRMGFYYVYYTWYKDVPCYDGGCGGTDIMPVNEYVSFKYIDQSEWDKRKAHWQRVYAARIANSDIDTIMRAIKWRFGYHGFLKDANFPVLPDTSSGSMLMKDPFGLPGVFELSLYEYRGI